MNNKSKNVLFISFAIFLATIVFLAILGCVDEFLNSNNNEFYLIVSSENKVIDENIKEFAKKENIKINIEYEDTQKIIKRLNKGEKYDAVWLSNSIWNYQLDSKNVTLTNNKSTSINPVIFGIRKSKASELGFVDKDIYTKDIVSAIKSGKLKFTMANPTTTNAGASAYLGILASLLGNPEVITSEMLNKDSLKEELKTFLGGVERTSGDEEYLEETYLNGNFDAVFTYESSIININKKLSSKNEEILYAIYPLDGVAISDSTIYYVDNKNDEKKEIYDKLSSYLTGEEGQKLLANSGRRTWYGGVTTNANKDVFNPSWGIDTTKYITPLKYPSTKVIQEALYLYQSALRKSVHVAFCLDYSGSMYGKGYNKLVDAMDYILTSRAEEELIQFSDDDKIDVLAFSSLVDDPWSIDGINEASELLDKIKKKTPSGSTALYPCVKKALETLKDENNDKYNSSVVVLTDGEGNVGSYKDLENFYKNNKFDIPIYSIKFLDASYDQLDKLSKLSNGKVFDGDTSLVDAFKEVRGYN